MLDEFKRDHELMLVMNMIDQEGNPVEVYAEVLQAVLDPRPLENTIPASFPQSARKRAET
jgi:hypothetical protein